MSEKPVDTLPDSDYRGVAVSGLGGLDPESAAQCMERFTKSFETSARRWELVVYPSLFAFIILAAYGFFLIYSLTADMSRVANSVDHLAQNMNSVTENMVEVSNNMADVSVNMSDVSANMADVSGKMDTMNASVAHMSDQMDTLEPMLANITTMNQNIAAMTQSVHSMTASMDQVRRDMGVMNYSVSRPMSFMNTFMPW